MGSEYRDGRAAAVYAVSQLRDENARIRSQVEDLHRRMTALEGAPALGAPAPRPTPRGWSVALQAGVVSVLVMGAGVAGYWFSGRSAAAPEALKEGAIGVASCDRYLQKWNDCYRDPALRAGATPALEQVKTRMRSMVNDPQSRAALSSACATMLANFPESACR